MNDLESILFNIDINSGAPTQGALLVAEPFLREEFFNHAVVVLVEYDAKGSAMGIVLNRQLDINVQSLVAEIVNEEPIPVYCGGPLSPDRLYYIHTIGHIIPNSQEIFPGLYVGGDFDQIIKYVNSHEQIGQQIRFFLGYSGWDKGQLADELRHHVWAVTQVRDSEILLDGAYNAYWHKIVRLMGEDYRGWLYHPISPSDN